MPQAIDLPEVPLHPSKSLKQQCGLASIRLNILRGILRRHGAAVEYLGELLDELNADWGDLMPADLPRLLARAHMDGMIPEMGGNEQIKKIRAMEENGQFAKAARETLATLRIRI
jgi:aryl carrier-like protein